MYSHMVVLFLTTFTRLHYRVHPAYYIVEVL